MTKIKKKNIKLRCLIDAKNSREYNNRVEIDEGRWQDMSILERPLLSFSWWSIWSSWSCTNEVSLLVQIMIEFPQKFA